MIVPYWVYRFFRPKYSMGAVGVLFNAQGQVLLVEHAFHPRTPWGLPGGWADRNEHPTRTVERELREELQIDVTAQQIIMIGMTYKNHLDIAVLCKTRDTCVKQLSYELLNYGWYALDDTPPILPFHREAIRQAAILLEVQPADEKTPAP